MKIHWFSIFLQISVVSLSPGLTIGQEKDGIQGKD